MLLTFPVINVDNYASLLAITGIMKKSMRNLKTIHISQKKLSIIWTQEMILVLWMCLENSIHQELGCVKLVVRISPLVKIWMTIWKQCTVITIKILMSRLNYDNHCNKYIVANDNTADDDA